MTLDSLIGQFIPPLREWYAVTTPFGAPIALGPDAGEPHNAIDLGTPQGTPVYAMRTGRVLAPNDNPEGVTGGGTVTIDYGDGIIVTMAHLSEIFVKEGASVIPGQRIGSTGGAAGTPGAGLATGSHLHIDAWQNGRKIDILDLFDWEKDTAPELQYQYNDDVGFRIPILSDIGDWGAALVAFFTAILNPENWARILAIIGGAILTLVGAYWVWASS